MEKSKVMFLGSFKYTKKSGGSTGYGYNIVQFYEKDGEKKCSTQTFFSDSELNIDGAEVGDLIECKMEQSFSLGGRPSLVGIKPVDKSVIFK